MSGLAMAVRLDGHVPPFEEARSLGSGAPYRRCAGVHERHIPAAVAIALAGAQEPGLGPPAPVASPDGSVLLVSDARIDNRDDVAAALGRADLARGRDDAALLLAAYAKWGEAFADRLSGDFAVAVWDAPRRRLVLARDRMGMRPLVYAAHGSLLLVASDVAQALAAGVGRDLNAARVLATLAGRVAAREWTYYRHVSRVPPGHTVVVHEGVTRAREHAPLAIPEPPGTLRDYAAELRSQLERAVRARLQVVESAGLLLSGGLDSLSIAATAGALGTRGVAVPRLTVFTFAYDELTACDERDASTAVAAQHGWPFVPVAADDAGPLAGHPDHGPDLDAPDRFQAHVAFARTLSLARAEGLKVLLSGQRGDGMIGENILDLPGRLLDLGPRAAWRDLRRHGRETRMKALRLLARSVLKPLGLSIWSAGAFPAQRERVRGALLNPAVPAWVRRDALRRFEIEGVARRVTFRSRLSGEARRHRHETALAERDARAAEMLERSFARAGIRHVAPWADRDLASWVLSVPQHALMPGGAPKGLLREAMRGLLPEAVRAGARKRTPRPAYDLGLRRARDVVEALTRDSRAAARGYVNEAMVREAYQQFLAGKAMPRDRFWAFLTVEDWLRRYHD